MRIHVDMNRCQAHGECVVSAPDVFALADDDELLWAREVAEDRRSAVEDAIQVCPMMAIRIDG